MVYDVNIWRWDRENDGSERVRRLPGSTVWDSFPSLSPDGERLAYVSNRTGSNEIWIAKADGSDARRVTSNIRTVFHPRWSPDGQRLVFASQSNGNWDVWVVRANGADLFQLTKESSQEENPTWSRDGRSVYFRSDRSGIGQIWRVSASGGAAVLMTPGPAAQAFESPDGRILYFVRRDDQPGLWSVPIAGGSETLVSPDVSHDLWAVTNEGIGFLTRSSTGPPWIPTLRLLAFNTRTVSSLATLPAGWFLPGFSMTLDGRAATWVRPDTRQNQLMIIPEWR
jgi:Tol biopolymer transport system component